MVRIAHWLVKRRERHAAWLPALILAVTAVTGGAAADPQVGPQAGPQECKDLKSALGVSRTIAIDTSTGHLFGSMTSLPREPSFLRAKEVVLTFDDGPMPWVTKSVLDTLDRYCTKGTFFSVGRMAMAYPSTVRDLVARGHTLASHTYSHPFQLPHLAPHVAHDEIDRGVAAVSAAAGIDVAPFFRFPGLAASRTLIDYAASRGLVTFTVDVVSNDSYIRDAEELATRTLREIESRGRGIVLFHDIKSTTAKALPKILEGLSRRGYKVVHMIARKPAVPRKDLMAEFTPRAEKALSVAQASSPRLPFYGTTGPAKSASSRAPVEVKRLAKAKPIDAKTPALRSAGLEADAGESGQSIAKTGRCVHRCISGQDDRLHPGGPRRCRAECWAEGCRYRRTGRGGADRPSDHPDRRG